MMLAPETHADDEECKSDQNPASWGDVAIVNIRREIPEYRGDLEIRIDAREG